MVSKHHLAAPLPVPNPTSSYWLGQPHPTLEDFNTAKRLPSEAATLIIGSGISGALIAHEVLKREPNASLVMIDARNVCNGASGRNGGHIKPDRYKNFARLKQKYGAGTAKRLCEFEVENMQDFVAFIRGQGLADAIDLVETRGVDFFMNTGSWSDAQLSIQGLNEAGGNLAGLRTFGKTEADKKFDFKDVSGAVSYPAYSLWPRKLVLALIESAVGNGLQLFTHTPVTNVTESPGEGKWLVETTRGTVLCNRVFHATNAYASRLLPEFAGKIVPVKGNVVAIDPSPKFASSPLSHTSGIQWGADFDYMIQRPNGGKPLIMGGRDLAQPQSLAGPMCDADDSVTTLEIRTALTSFPALKLKGWGTGASARYSWSGILGFTADEVPFVGEVPGRPGQFIVAGYTGHGMARAFLTVNALVQLAYGEKVDPRVPKPYWEVRERLARENDSWEAQLKKADALHSKGRDMSKL